MVEETEVQDGKIKASGPQLIHEEPGLNQAL